MRLPPTPSQTVGPYFGIALTPKEAAILVPEDDPRSIQLLGTVSDGEGKPVREGLIEIWQADEDGRYPGPEDRGPDRGFSGFGRCHTDDDGAYRFLTLKPGPVPAPGGGLQAPHISVAIIGLGLLKPLRTRVYFSDEDGANSRDPVLSMVNDPRKPLLVARVEGRRAVLDFRLQGDAETPFFNV